MPESNITEFVDYLPLHAKIKLAARQAGITATRGGSRNTGHLQAEIDAEVAAIEAMPGPNSYARANNLLCARSPKHKALPLQDQHRIAGEYVRALLSGQAPAQVTSVPSGGISEIGKDDVGARAAKILADIAGQPIEKQHSALLEFCNGLAGKTTQTASAPTDAQSIVASINAQPGPNVYAKANRYLLSVSARHRNLPSHEQHRVAGEFTRALLNGSVLREHL